MFGLKLWNLQIVYYFGFNMTELGVTKEVDWRDHFIYCVK
jgi:hypothetical protein